MTEALPHERRYAEVLLLSEGGVPPLWTREGWDEAAPFFLDLAAFARGRLKVRARWRDPSFDAWAPGAGRCEVEGRPPDVFARCERPAQALGVAFDQVFHLAVAVDLLTPEAEATRRALIRHVASKGRLLLAGEQRGPWGTSFGEAGAYVRLVQEAAADVYYGGMGPLPELARLKGAWRAFDPG